MVKEVCNSVWVSDWGAELPLLSWPAFRWCLFGRAVLPSGNTSVSPPRSVGGVWRLQSQCRSLQWGGSSVHHSLLTVPSLVFWSFTSRKQLIWLGYIIPLAGVEVTL